MIVQTETMQEVVYELNYFTQQCNTPTIAHKNLSWNYGG